MLCLLISVHLTKVLKKIKCQCHILSSRMYEGLDGGGGVSGIL